MKKLRLKMFQALLLSILCGIFSASPSWAQEVYTPSEEEASKWSLENARDEVQRDFSQCDSIHPWKVQVMPDIITVSWLENNSESFSVWEFRELHSIKVTLTEPSGGFLSPRVESSLNITASGHIHVKGKNFTGVKYECGNGAGRTGRTKAWGDALLRLKLEYDKANKPEGMEKFREEVLRYQAMDPKPELPEDARRFRVQAEKAVADKRFLDAIEKYEKAIEIAPWWPEAHFNRAVVLAELQNFDTATVEMKRYLLLKPDAPDARRAKDFIYTWEDRPFSVK
jgi:tetratricopeptide (TPR) repeat protein